MKNRANISDDESEEDDEEINIPTLKKNTPRHARRSPRISGNEPQYAGLYCIIEGAEDILDTEGVSNMVHRDNCFLSTVDPSTSRISPATRYLDSTPYALESGSIDNVYPYAFFAKVQTYTSDNPTYKDIVCLPDEEGKLWDAAMVKELKSLRDLGSFKMVSRPRGGNILMSTWAFKKKRYPDGALKSSRRYSTCEVTNKLMV